MSERLRKANLYTPRGERFDVGVAHHNVADLLEVDKRAEYKVKAKYGQRFGHVPVGGSTEGILLTDPSSVQDEHVQALLTRGNDNAAKQAAYIGELSGDAQRFTLFTPATLRETAESGAQVLLVPYLNNGKLKRFRQEEGLDGPNFQVNGMDHDVVSALKNKSEFHHRVKAEGNPDFAVPHHEVVNVQDIAVAGKALFDFEDQLYNAIDMPDYQRGIFGRLNYSDGGFGSFNIKRNAKGEYVLKADDEHVREPYATMEDALAEAQRFMIKGSGNNLEADVVLSRALDLIEVPGLSMHFIDGEVMPLGFNAQILDEHTKACIGTSTYEPTHPHVVTKRDEYEVRVAQAAKAFVHDIAREKQVAVDGLHGFINVDVMIIGEKERLAQKRLTEGLAQGAFGSELRSKLEKYGQLPEPVDYFLAESNPRRTNMIEAIDEVMLVENLPQTLASMQEVMAHGIRAEDSYQVPPGVDVDDLANALGERYAQDVRGDGLVLMRTRPIQPTNPGERSSIGVIMTGDTYRRQSELERTIRAVRKAA